MRNKFRSDVPLETIREYERMEREHPEQMAFAGRLLCGISHSYEVPYFDRFDDLQHCAIHPGDGALEEIEIEGFPDDEESQEKVAREFVRAVAGDFADHHLASELTAGEQSHVDGLQHRTLADRSFEEMAAEWQAEDAAEDDQDELLESRRAIGVEFRQLLGRYGPALQREGFGGHIRALAALLAVDPSEFDPARADELLSGIQSFALSLSNSF